jgi:hypothetical protein
MAPHHPTEEELAERGRMLVEATADVRAPHALRERIEADRTRAAGRGRRRRLALPAAGLAALTAVLVALLVLSGDEPGSGPSFADAAALTARPDAPGIERTRVGDRDATTIAYSGPQGTTIGYTIVQGPPLDPPGGRDVVRRGTKYTVVHDDGRTLVTWVQGGRTCIVGAPKAVPDARLVSLAASF